jgi:hypothetical protein
MAALPLHLSTTGSRSRPQARKKPNDDASYFGPPLPGSGAAGTKRQAADKVESEPRGKRKRTEQAPRRDVVENEPRASLVRVYSHPCFTCLTLAKGRVCQDANNCIVSLSNAI